MSAILRLCLLLLIYVPLWAWADGLSSECQQVLLVTAPDPNRAQAKLQRYQRGAEGWQPVGKPIRVVLGRAGLAWGLSEEETPPQEPHKKEGDNRSPAGVYEITQLWMRRGIAPPPPGGFPVHWIYADTVGVDDPKSRYYNRILRASEVHEPDWESWEKMDISDYDRVLVVSHNTRQPRPGAGSCIFMHRWEGPNQPTAGCTAMAETDFVQVINWLRPESHPRLVQLPAQSLPAWLDSHQFPTAK
ncbi:L,D-transpeptidase family protein [bacterium]|nr:L,D-transpeptidase family protein [bacterium]